jgi:hypothetical protein
MPLYAELEDMLSKQAESSELLGLWILFIVQNYNKYYKTESRKL